MKKARLLGAALAACCLFAAGSAQAASVLLNSWAFGQGHAVAGTMDLNAYAGGFGGSLTGAGAHDDLSFLTYCIELEESFQFSSKAMTDYAVVDAASYFGARQLANPARPDGAMVAERLGRLLTFVNDNPSQVDTALESSAMQLAIWNIVYDTDASVMANNGGSFRLDSGGSQQFGGRVTSLLAGAAGVSVNRFDVYALTRNGTQDFLLGAQRGDVPEPGSFALAGLALLGLRVAGRRRG